MPEQPGPFIPADRGGGRRRITRRRPPRCGPSTKRPAETSLCTCWRSPTTPRARPDSATSEAHTALHAAAAAVQAAGKPVRVVREVLTGSPTLCLLKASRTAAMVCVGALGLRHWQPPDRFDRRRPGGLAQCPVAVVRGGEPTDPGWVVVEVDDTPQSAAVLQFAVTGEAGAPPPCAHWAAGSRATPTSTTPTRCRRETELVRAQLDRRLSEAAALPRPRCETGGRAREHAALPVPQRRVDPAGGGRRPAAAEAVGELPVRPARPPCRTPTVRCLSSTGNGCCETALS